MPPAAFSLHKETQRTTRVCFASLLAVAWLADLFEHPEVIRLARVGGGYLRARADDFFDGRSVWRSWFSSVATRCSRLLTSWRSSGSLGMTACAFIQVSCGMTGAPETI